MESVLFSKQHLQASRSARGPLVEGGLLFDLLPGDSLGPRPKSLGNLIARVPRSYS
jgi:hypothetical protein